MQLTYFCRGMALIVAAGLAISCQPVETDENVANDGNEAQEAEAAAPPPADLPLDREGLLLAAMRAASAHATGLDDNEAQRILAGRRFEVRIRFGCPTDPEADQTFAIRVQEQPRMIRLRAAPDITAEDPLAAQFAGEIVEVVEGFWIRRPWLLVATCPVQAQPTENDEVGDKAGVDGVAAGHARIGIAQFVGEGYARTFQRRQRPYETSKTLAEGETPSVEGYDLVLSGRLRRLGNRRVINCAAPGPDQPPDCIISAVFERIWLERPDRREVLEEWVSG